ncbi:hypothetical protein R0135_17320 [Congregibacter variabilis]|uniref:MerC mercury resistance protein n=1 Tax=Congregibacter variabilis TaxID=3081200 RepID=A0ABZ0I414_9GAMM|nr:hypothetical protein R0135_17320 [Congregibacter sp. IMCC43200]
MHDLRAFLVGGHAAELIVALVCCELAFLWFRFRYRAGAHPRQWLSPLLAGAALVVALRLSQSGAPEELLGLALAVAGLAHLMGYRQRWYG